MVHFLSLKKNESFIFHAALVHVLSSPEAVPVLAWLTLERENGVKVKYFWFLPCFIL